MDRRQFLRAGGAVAVAPVVASSLTLEASRMPSLFYAHGAPFLATDRERGAALSGLSAMLPVKPSGIIAFTPHVRAEHVSIAASGIARRSFPRRFIKRVGDLQYVPPPAIGLAEEVRGRLATLNIPLAEKPHRAFNHTIWMGMFHMFPAAEIPLVEVAMPFATPQRIYAMGLALAPLRDNGVLIVSSGSLTHNLATLGINPTPRWAVEFDQLVDETLTRNDIDSLLDWRERAPASRIVHPDDGGHFNVLMFAPGSGHRSRRAFSMNVGWEFGSFSTRDLLLS